LKGEMNSKTKFILLIGFIVISVFVAAFSQYFGLNLSSFGSLVSVNHNLAAFLYTLLFVVLASFSFSVSVMVSFGSLLFSVYEVVIYAMIGIMVSASVHFYISRKLGRSYVRNYLARNKGVEKFDEIVENNTFKTILILSAVFFVPPIVPNLLGGVIKINFKKYFIATFLGNLPNTFFTVYLIGGFIYSNIFQIYISIIGLVATTLIALYFYNGEIIDILRLSFPSIFKRKN
jgi:uncharacterized membrane protein YdjX (TVP38/TMEM64 family)